jgi:hypothetical protein
MRRAARWPGWCAAAALLGACASELDTRILGNADSQVSLRSIQSREFDSGDTAKTLKTVMATLQDLGFVLDRVDEGLGVTSGTKSMGAMRPTGGTTFADAMGAFLGSGRAASHGTRESALRITVTVRPQSATRLVVRANAELDQQTIRDPQQYQNFFSALEKAMFLTAHQVD